MSIFTELSEIKSFVGGAVNESIYLRSLEPFFDIAHERHMEDWLGVDLYNMLSDCVETQTFLPEQTALLPYYRRALAWLALYEYHPHAAVQFSEAGLMRVESETHKTAYKYQESAKLRSTLQNGYEALEKLILFLENNKADYPDWEDAPGYLRHHEVLLHTAAVFRIAQSKKITRHVFDLVRGIIEDVEQFAIVPLIGEDQYEALLTARKTGTWTTETMEKKVIYLLQRAVAHFTLDNAIRLGWAQFEGDSVVQSERPDDHPDQRTASGLPVGLRLNFHDYTANRWLKKAKAYLDTNIDEAAFADYKAYAAALAAAAEEEAAAAATAACTDTSERNDCGNAFGFGQPCTGSSRKGVVTL